MRLPLCSSRSPSACAACVGGSATRLSTSPSRSPAPDVFDCVRRQLKAAGFAQNSIRRVEQRLTARKIRLTSAAAGYAVPSHRRSSRDRGDPASGEADPHRGRCHAPSRSTGLTAGPPRSRRGPRDLASGGPDHPRAVQPAGRFSVRPGIVFGLFYGRSAIPESERVAVPLVQLTRSAPDAPGGPPPPRRPRRRRASHPGSR